jgi:predicted negative regulator of RcsB-dependent stress response
VATEKEAADDYESIMRRATRADDQRSRERISKALLKLSEEFPNTVYGRIAASAVKEK